MSCPADRPAPLRCPTLDESIDATAKLLPRGRAWPANDGGAILARFRAWLVAMAAPPAPTAWPFGFVQAGYVSAIGAVRHFLETRLCALRLEFWCATMTETRDLWMQEYGLPDACDPFPDLCTKVAAIGGTRCEYYAEVAARAGWSVTCRAGRDHCGGTAGAARAGCFKPGVRSLSSLLAVVVDLGESPAYAGGQRAFPLAGRLKAGRPLTCGPDLTPLRCIIERIVHAELSIIYEVIQ
ncbi:hypothetical protein RA307_09780 [Xanthobacteraceae bacterium Astr-EGSB]|uniref:hypothetical protein n=1 Tax=Astrobacterium formosum TaxID=3069710 RepID=UPI0027B25AF6|nr:hypothetical protein [Xanthobacteraceae bacterium Astr-EGSB]